MQNFQEVRLDLTQLNNAFFISFEILPNIITWHPIFFNFQYFKYFENSDMILVIWSLKDQMILHDIYFKKTPTANSWQNLKEFFNDKVPNAIYLNNVNEKAEAFSREVTSQNYNIHKEDDIYSASLNPQKFKASSNQKRKINYTHKLLNEIKFKTPTEEELQQFIKEYKKFQLLKSFKLNINTSSLKNLASEKNHSQFEVFLVSANYENQNKQLEVKNIVLKHDKRAFYLFGLTLPFQYKASTFSPGLHCHYEIIEFLKNKGVEYYDLGQLMKDEKSRRLDDFKLSLAHNEEKRRYQILTKN